jgi:hypothetical protein
VSEPRASALAYLWRHHRPAVIGLTLALVAVLFFAVRLTVFTIYWSDPAHREQAVEGWMTPGFVARSWDLPPEAIRAALPPPVDGTADRRRTLEAIATAEGIALPDLIARVEAAIAGTRSQ